MFLQPYFPVSWHSLMKEEFSKKYFLDLEQFLLQEKNSSTEFFPPEHLIFQALKATSPSRVKVVILGQDPYHGQGQAEGLSFSVPNKIKRPPSLGNIFKELASDLDVGALSFENNSLLSWAGQGVLLLNSVLTVKKSLPASHAGRGWESFTDALIDKLNKTANNIVFILWGTYAQKKAEHLDGKKHLVLCSSHPSPFSAHRGFLGSKVFSKTNVYLVNCNKQPINWLSVLEA